MCGMHAYLFDICPHREWLCSSGHVCAPPGAYWVCTSGCEPTGTATHLNQMERSHSLLPYPGPPKSLQLCPSSLGLGVCTFCHGPCLTLLSPPAQSSSPLVPPESHLGPTLVAIFESTLLPPYFDLTTLTLTLLSLTRQLQLVLL